MVRGSGSLLKSAGAGISFTLAEILVCPLSKQPLRLCEKTNSLVSDSIGVSYPIVDGIPRLVPSDGKIMDAYEDFDPGNGKDSREIYSSPKKMNEVPILWSWTFCALHVLAKDAAATVNIMSEYLLVAKERFSPCLL